MKCWVPHYNIFLSVKGYVFPHHKRLQRQSHAHYYTEQLTTIQSRGMDVFHRLAAHVVYISALYDAVIIEKCVLSSRWEYNRIDNTDMTCVAQVKSVLSVTEGGVYLLFSPCTFCIRNLQITEQTERTGF